MVDEVSVALEPTSFTLTQIHKTGVEIVSTAPLELVHIIPSRDEIIFYCSSKHISLQVSLVTKISNENGSIKLSSDSLVSVIALTPSSSEQSRNRYSTLFSHLSAIIASKTSEDKTLISSDSTSKNLTASQSDQQSGFTSEIRKTVSSGNDFSSRNPRSSEFISESAESKCNLSLNKLHSDAEALRIIDYARNAHSFQATKVLETIVNNELERIKSEKSKWKVAGAIAGLALGMTDGFQVTDLFSSIALSNVGGMAHDFASKEQKEFLEKVKSDWLISRNSALEICHRLGPPRQRTVTYFPSTGQLTVSNLHENPSRGTFLVPLGAAKDHAAGFKNDDSLTALYNNFTEDDVEMLAYQLYPNDLVELSSTKKISLAKASQMNPYHELLLDSPEVTQLMLKDSDATAIAYKIIIPIESEY